MLKPVTSIACLCLATAVMAEPSRLTGAQITELVAGATVEIGAPFGNKLPVRYGADGLVMGEARDLASYLGAPSDIGRWWVSGDQLCHKWNRWFDAETRCLRLRKDGRRVHWSSQDGETGTATITVPGPGRTQVAVAQPPPRVQPEGMMRLSPAQPHPDPAAAASSFAPVEAPKPPVAVAPAPAHTKPSIIAAVPNAEAPPPQPSAAGEPRRTAAVSSAPVARGPADAKPKPESAQAAAAARALFMVAKVRSDDVLNIRSGPSAEHDIVAGLPPGSRGVAITGACQTVWCPVQHERGAGWVNRSFLISESAAVVPISQGRDALPAVITQGRGGGIHHEPDAPRSCLSAAARDLLARIEDTFGPVRTISTCRRGATISGSVRPSRHASGNAIDFDAGARKAEVVRWLVANHRNGGTMTYGDMNHIHVDIGPHFVSIASGEHWASWRQNRTDRGG